MTAVALVEQWQALRAELRALDRVEHPDVTDRHGRVWVWWNGDTYAHDGLLAWPRDFITAPHGLPEPGLAERNPSYAGLCAICRHQTTNRKA